LPRAVLDFPIASQGVRAASVSGRRGRSFRGGGTPVADVVGSARSTLEPETVAAHPRSAVAHEKASPQGLRSHPHKDM